MARRRRHARRADGSHALHDGLPVGRDLLEPVALGAPRYRWLLFDADGTLFDYEKAAACALERTFTDLGERFQPSDLESFQEINQGLWLALERGEITAERLRSRRFELLCETRSLQVSPDRIGPLYLRHLAAGADLMEGAHEVVAALHRAYRLAIVTNGLEDVQRARLARSPLAPYFPTMIVSEEVGAAKPDRAFFEAAFDRLGRPDRAEVLIIGDSLSSDMAGGLAYGLDTCWFNPSGQPCRPDLGCTYEIRRLDDLTRLLL